MSWDNLNVQVPESPTSRFDLKQEWLNIRQKVREQPSLLVVAAILAGLAFIAGVALSGFYFERTIVPRRIQAALAALPTPTPTPTPYQPTPTPMPTPTPTPVTFRVQAAGGSGAFLRAEPSLDSAALAVVPNGTRVIWLGEQYENQGYTWYLVQVDLPQKGRLKGWMAHVVLQP